MADRKYSNKSNRAERLADTGNMYIGVGKKLASKGLMGVATGNFAVGAGNVAALTGSKSAKVSAKGLRIGLNAKKKAAAKKKARNKRGSI